MHNIHNFAYRVVSCDVMNKTDTILVKNKTLRPNLEIVVDTIDAAYSPSYAKVLLHTIKF